MRHPRDDKPIFPPGTKLDDRFVVRECLGAGAFGAVYRAQQLVFGHPMREVALKLFHADNVHEHNLADVFRDAVVLVRLQEENPPAEVAGAIIQVYDIGLVRTPSPQAFMSMKLVGGRRTLENEIRRCSHGGMTVEVALGYLRQLLTPLAWMHSPEVGYVHGDLKPDNVLLTEDHRVVLTDFGLAAGLLLGSVGGAIQYQAPESLAPADDQLAFAPADVYAVGLIWYEMLTGKHPFADVGLESTAAGEPQSAFIHCHLEARKWPFGKATCRGSSSDERRIAPPSEFNKEMRSHPQLEALLGKCLSYRASERPANAQILLQQIDNYVQSGRIRWLEGRLDDRPCQCDDGKSREHALTRLLADADVLLAGGRAGEALDRVVQALELDPRCVPALLVKARVLAAQGNISAARQVCNEATAVDKDNLKVVETLAGVYKTAGNHGMAKRTLDRLKEMKKKRPASR